MTIYTLTIQADHYTSLTQHLLRQDTKERIAYLLCKKADIASDPWDRQRHFKLLSYEVITISDDELIESTSTLVTVSTTPFIRALKKAKTENMVVVQVHNHPTGFDEFSTIDNENEAELYRLARNRNGYDVTFASLIITTDELMTCRMWLTDKNPTPFSIVRVVGKTLKLHYSGRGSGTTPDAFHRQALAFGPALHDDLSRLKVGVVGAGGTGSAVGILIPRMGVGQVVFIDKDIAEDTNLNRLHGARQADADAMRPKVEIAARSITELGLGTRVVTSHKWVGDPECWDLLKACDVIFCCTDDHDGRLFLNRFAYYYAIPVIDLGLAMTMSKTEPAYLQSLEGRVTVIGPGHTCLVCRGMVDSTIARDEALARTQPAEFEKRKAEAYVQGGGNLNPAVVTFTTEVATMAVNELLQRIQRYRGEGATTDCRTRSFQQMRDIKPAMLPNPECPFCGKQNKWGIGDVHPFLDRSP